MYFRLKQYFARVGVAAVCAAALTTAGTAGADQKSITLTYDGLGVSNNAPIPDPYPGINLATVRHFGTDQHAAIFEDVFFWDGLSPSNGYGNLSNVAVGPRGMPSDSGLTNPAWGFISITPNYPGTFVRLTSFDLASFDDNNLDESDVEIFVHDEFPYLYVYWSLLGLTVAGDVNNATHSHFVLANASGSPIEGPVDIGMSIWWKARGGRVGVDNVKFEIVGPIPGVFAKNDFFSVSQGATLNVAPAGVLENDLLREATGPMNAALLARATNGTLFLTNNGGFTYTSTNAVGMDGFAYLASDRASHSSTGFALVSVLPPGALFYDDFARPPGFAALSPWKVERDVSDGWEFLGAWAITNGMLHGITNGLTGHAGLYLNNDWGDYSVEVRASIPTNCYGWSIAGRLNPVTGEHYEVFLYAFGSGGPWELQLTKQIRWGTSGWDGVNLANQPNVVVPEAGTTNLHSLKMTFQGNRVLVHYDGILKMDVRDDNFPCYGQPWPVFSSGGILLGMYATNDCVLRVEDVIVRQLPITSNLVVATSEDVSTNLVLQGSIGEGTKTFGILSGPLHGELTGLNPNSGAITYRPATNYHGADAFEYTVSDGSLVATGTVSVTISAVNDAPVLTVSGPDSIEELLTLVVTNIAIDADGPGNVLTFTLEVGPNNAIFDAGTGLLTWTPEEDQGPCIELFRIRVTDDGIPPLSATNEFAVTVHEVNLPPVLGVIEDQTITEGQTLTLTTVAIDPDIPANSFLFSLGPDAPAGMTLTTDGVLTWTPQAKQTPSSNYVSVIVTDSGSPNLTATQHLRVTVTTQPLVIESVHLLDSFITITWNAVVGQTYRLECKDTPTETNWTAVSQDFVATGPTATAVDSSYSAPRRFYRVVRIP